MKNITRDYAGAKEKGLEVLWDESTGNIRVESENEIFEFVDDLIGDASVGSIIERVKRFIEEY